MDFCVMCGEYLKVGDDVISLEIGKIAGVSNGHRFCRHKHIEIHWLCFLELIQTVKSIAEAEVGQDENGCC